VIKTDKFFIFYRFQASILNVVKNFISIDNKTFAYEKLFLISRKKEVLTH
jgi:hypothetical protein